MIPSSARNSRNASRVPFVAAALAKACSISTSARRFCVRSLSFCAEIMQVRTDVETISVAMTIDFLNIETLQAINYISLAPPFDNHLALAAPPDFNFLCGPLRNPLYSSAVSSNVLEKLTAEENRRSSQRMQRATLCARF